MKDWIKRAKKLLEKSLKPLPHELNELDWKIKLSEKNQRLNEHLIAMSQLNNGGFFTFGLNDDGEFEGISKEENKKIIAKLTQLARNGVEPKLKIDHNIENMNNKNILFIYIEEALQKPVHLRGKGIEFTFIRSGGSTVKADNTDLICLLQNSKILTYEEQNAESFKTIRELLDKIDYKTFFNLLRREIPSSDEKILEELIKHKLASQKNEKYSITNLGVLTIAKDMTEFSGHFNRGVRVITYNKNNNINRNLDISGIKGYAIGFNSIINYLKRLLPQNEIIETVFREIRPIYPEKLLREIIANALIHQDLRNQTNPRIEIFPNRIEITSAGNLPNGITIERMIDNNFARNPILVKTFFDLRLCENRGSGIDRAFEAIEEFNLPPLGFQEDKNYFKVIIYAPKKYEDMSKKERIEACYQHCASRYMNKETKGFMNNTSLRKRFNFTKDESKKATRLITDTIKAKKIKIGNPKNNAPKNIYYIPYWA